MTSKKKSLFKTITWRITASLATLLIVYMLTGELAIAGGVASIEVVLKMGLYYVHERAWEKVEVEDDCEGSEFVEIGKD